MVELGVVYIFLAVLVKIINDIIWMEVHPAVMHGSEDPKVWNRVHFVLNSIAVLLFIRAIFIFKG